MHVYRCPKGCHIRIYPFWVGDEGEKCPRCGEWMVYKGQKTEEQLRQMQIDLSKNQLKKDPPKGWRGFKLFKKK